MTRVMRRASAALLLVVFLLGINLSPATASVETAPLDAEAAELVMATGCFGCALAVAGTLTVSISAIFVSGPAALAVWAVSKGLATASLIDSCASCAT